MKLNKTTRPLVEIVAMLAVSETAVVLALAALAPGFAGLVYAVINLTLLSIVSGPLFLWRLSTASRRKQSSVASQGRRTSGRVKLLVIGTMCVGLMMTAVGSYIAARAERHEARTKFDRLTEHLVAEITRRVALPVYGMKGARGVYAASHSVERGEFAAYVASRNLPVEFPGVQGFGFVERVPSQKLQTFLATERADEAPDFNVHGAGDAPAGRLKQADEADGPAPIDLLVIKHMFPLEPNRASWGFDIGSDPVRRAAAEEAIRTGLPTITAPITLVKDAVKRPGFLFFVPIYRNQTHPTTPLEREQCLVGLVFTPVILSETLADLSDSVDGAMGTAIFDGTVESVETELLPMESRADLKQGETAVGLAQPPLFCNRVPIVVGNRTWTLVSSSTPKFEAEIDNFLPALIGAGGTLLSALFAAIVWSIGVSHSRAIAIAVDMTSELAESKTTAETALREFEALRSTLDMHLISSVADPAGKIIDVNDQFCQISGYTREELLGQDHSILNSEFHPKSFWVDMWRTIASGNAWRGEVCNRSKAGGMYWVDSIISPFKSSTGKIVKYVSIRHDITDRKVAEVELQRATERLALATVAGGVGVWDFDVTANHVVWDDQMFRLYGISSGEFDGVYDAWRNLLVEEDRKHCDEEIQLALRGEKPFDTEFHVRWRSGSVRIIRAIATVQWDDKGHAVRMVGTNWDITDIKAMEEQARGAEQFLRSAIDSLEARTVVINLSGRIHSVNRPWRDFGEANVGSWHDAAEGTNYLALCEQNAGTCGEAGLVADAIRAVLSGEIEPTPIEYGCHTAAEKRWFVCSIRGFSRGVERSAVVSHGNITARKLMEEELRTAARIDKLTGLPNRALVSDRLQQAVLRARRLANYHFAVLFLDFDRFKAVNDSLGHEVGDMLLREIGQRLRTTIRSGDSLSRNACENTAARLGGDEFVVLLDAIADPSDVLKVADRLLEVLSKPYFLNDHKVHSTASIGIYTSDMPAESADDVLRDADMAMYEAKLAGKGRYVVFDAAMRQRVQNRLNLESDLRDALEADQFLLVYQPIVSLQSGALESVEALVRWNHPVRGLISPGEFIPIAEETDLILPIGEWVLRRACEQFMVWRGTMGADAPRTISVNLSRKQLAVEDLPDTIQRILDQTGMEAACLQLEVTESAIMRDVAAGTQVLKQIKQHGVRLAMDDFGTGYSSLSCLHQFPMDILKIDRSFIANIDRGRDFAALVHAVAQLARNLNIGVVAEGIETLEQAIVLQSLECEYGQGYFFSKPLTGEELARYKVRSSTLPGQAA